MHHIIVHGQGEMQVVNDWAKSSRDQYSFLVYTVAVEFGVKMEACQIFSQNPRHYFKNWWTNTWLVCTHLNEFSCWIWMLQCKFWITTKCLNILIFHLHWTFPCRGLKSWMVVVVHGEGKLISELTLSLCKYFIWMSEVSNMHHNALLEVGSTPLQKPCMGVLPILATFPEIRAMMNRMFFYIFHF